MLMKLGRSINEGSDPEFEALNLRNLLMSEAFQILRKTGFDPLFSHELEAAPGHYACNGDSDAHLPEQAQETLPIQNAQQTICLSLMCRLAGFSSCGLGTYAAYQFKRRSVS
jgi:hypothetical protein